MGGDKGFTQWHLDPARRCLKLAKQSKWNWNRSHRIFGSFSSKIKCVRTMWPLRHQCSEYWSLVTSIMWFHISSLAQDESVQLLNLTALKRNSSSECELWKCTGICYDFCFACFHTVQLHFHSQRARNVTLVHNWIFPFMQKISVTFLYKWEWNTLNSLFLTDSSWLYLLWLEWTE